MPAEEPGRARRKLSRRLVALVALTMAVPSALFFGAGRSLIADLSRASAGAEQSYLEVQRAAQGAAKNADRLIALNVLGVASAVAAHLEYLVRREPALLAPGADVTEHREVFSILTSQRLGATTLVGLVDHKARTMVAHAECAQGTPLSSCMPLGQRLLDEVGYEKKLASIGSLSQTIGQAPGMAYSRLLEHHFYQDQGNARFFVVATPIRGTPWSLLIESRASGVFSPGSTRTSAPPSRRPRAICAASARRSAPPGHARPPCSRPWSASASRCCCCRRSGSGAP